MKEVQFNNLQIKYDKLQEKYGSKNLRSIYYGGRLIEPDLFFVFMNPTARNIASSPAWTGIRAPWIGTNRIWELFFRINRFNEDLFIEIKKKKSHEWTPEFANKVYREVAAESIFVSNFAKCTQEDARKVSDTVYLEYLPLLEEEIKLVNPKKIVLFGNQVSSLFLGDKISVSKVRKRSFKKVIGEREVNCYPVYYPVGNGYMNIDKAIEDLNWIISNAGAE